MIFHKNLFIGLLFIFIDINIGSFDIAPDMIGYIFIFNAFIKVAKPYAGLGLATTIILLGYNIVTVFSSSNWMILYSEEVIHYNFSQQLFQIVLGATNIVNYACMFAVSHAIMPIKSKKLPGVFISLLLLLELVSAFFYYLTPEELLLVFVPLAIMFFITYIVFLHFLWKRSKVEASKIKPSVNVSVDDVVDELV